MEEGGRLYAGRLSAYEGRPSVLIIRGGGEPSEETGPRYTLTQEEAERLALEGMGEAEPLSQALAQAHSRLLGSVYKLSQLLLVVVLPLVALEGVIMLWRWILPLAIPGWPF